MLVTAQRQKVKDSSKGNMLIEMKWTENICQHLQRTKWQEGPQGRTGQWWLHRDSARWCAVSPRALCLTLVSQLVVLYLEINGSFWTWPRWQI